MDRDRNSVSGEGPTPSLSQLLETTRADLERFLRYRGSGLLRYEGVDDLVQGVHLRAVSAYDRLEYRGDRQFLEWLRTLARNHIADRHDYWKAQKRRAGRMLRIVTSDSSSTSAVNPATSQTSPSSFAMRKEQFVVAMKAIAVLLPRDQEILRMVTEEASLEDIAEKYGLSYGAAQKARHRVIERFQKTFEVMYEGPQRG